MSWHRSSVADPLASNWREAVQAAQQEVAQRGGASLQALTTCLDRFPGVPRGDLSTLAQDLAFIGQQLHTLSSQASAGTDSFPEASCQHQQQQQQQQQAHAALIPVLQACVRFCKAVTDALAAVVARPQEPKPQHSRWQHSQRHRQQRQHQPQPQQQQPLLPAAAATALCSCLRQWADPMLLPAGLVTNQSDQNSDLPGAAIAALEVLLPTQLPVIAAHERAAVLAMLLATAQPRAASSSGSSSSGGAGCAASSTAAAVLGEAGQADVQDSLHWGLSCKAVTVLTTILSEASRTASKASAAATSSSSSSSRPALGAPSGATAAAAVAGLQPEEAASITAGLVEALSTSCGIRSSSSSSSRGGSTGGAGSVAGAAAIPPASGSSSCGGSRSSGGGAATSSSSRQQPVEGVLQSQYYAVLLVALNHAANSNKQGWQGHAGAITESARKLFTYGAQQQQQQSDKQPSAAAAESPAASSSGAAVAAAPPATGAAAQAAPVGQQTPKRKYVPPHARAAAAAAGAAGSPGTQSPQQQQQDSSDESEETASDWSDVSDSEYLSSRRASSSNSSSNNREQRSQLRQQQQQLHDPIKAARVRSALLQLLLTLVQSDPKALHPYWSALLPSQAPLQPAPLSPHLLTLLLYDPSDKVRLLAASVVAALLEGPTARALLAVAEARTPHPPLRGFITLSVSLGHMLLSLHAGLLAVVAAWQHQHTHTHAQQHTQPQPQQQQQQQGVLHVPGVLLTAVLRVLCSLVPVTPYERLPSSLLTEVVDQVTQLWQQLQPAAAATVQQQQQQRKVAGAGLIVAANAVPSLDLAAAAASAAGAGSAEKGGWAASKASSSSSSSAAVVAAVAVLAQAFSTKKPLPALGRWLHGGSSSSSDSRGSVLLGCLLGAAASPDCLLRIEALAALRGCCINYPEAAAALQAQPTSGSSGPGTSTDATSNGEATTSTTTTSTSTSSASSWGGVGTGCWQQLLAVVSLGVGAAALAASASSTPKSSPRASSTADAGAAAAAAAAADGGSGSTSPEVKAGQHAVRLLGDWLTAAAAAATTGGTTLSSSPAAAAATATVPPTTEGGGDVLPAPEPDPQLAAQWASILQLLLSDAVWRHPSAVIRSAAAAVCGTVPAGEWLLLPRSLRQQLLAATAETAAGADVTAVRAAACKLLGSCAVLPGVLQQQEQQLGHGQGSDDQQQLQEAGMEQQAAGTNVQQQQRQQQQEGAQGQEQRVLQALAGCVSDEAVSVRLSAAWALANVCDELRRLSDQAQAAAGTAAPCEEAAASGCGGEVHLACTQLPQQQQRQQQQQGLLSSGCGVVARPGVLRMLCDAAVAASGDTEKVRAHGVRAVGALLAAWQPSWGIDSGSTRSNTAASSNGPVAPVAAAAAAATASASGTAPQPSHSTAAAAAAAADAWSCWVPAWFRAAFGALQSCLAARSMKVVWNAACAAAAALQNQQLLRAPAVADSTPGLLRMLVVLVRDSSNYKIKTHAAAALAAPADRAAYGEVYADGLLVLLAALQALQGSSSSGGSVQAAGEKAAGAGVASASAAEGQQAGGGGDSLDDDGGAFPNYRYIPGLQAQLEVSLCHLLALLQPSDSNRLREQLRRHQQLLLAAVSKAAARERPAGLQLHVEAAAAGTSSAGAAPGADSRRQQQQQLGAADDGNTAAGGKAVMEDCPGLNGNSSHQLQQQGAQQLKRGQSALPADPFGQGAGVRVDGGVRVPGTTTSSSAAQQPDAAAAAVLGVAGSGSSSVSAGCGVNTGAIGTSRVVAAALAGLSSVLGASVLDAWGQQV